MKRSEAIAEIRRILTSAYDDPAVTILMKLEDMGMLPPDTTSAKCSDPDVYIKIDSPDAGYTIPTHIIQGWDDENT